jgi:hypothetical protein
MRRDITDLKRLNLPTGSHHHRAFVGPPEKYDIVSAMQFNLLTFLGLREDHYLLDIGCGSLRGGRLFMVYLLSGHYFGMEPEKWLIAEGIKNELGEDLIKIKTPVFSYDNNFTCTKFGQKFNFILAQSIFSHASEAQIRRCMCEVEKCMKPTSIFVATFVRGETNYTGDKWVYPGCVIYTLDHMVQLAKEVGLICKLINWFHPNQQAWILMTYPENEKNISDLSIGASLHLKSELNRYKERIAKLEKHPYVRLGLKINGIMQKIKIW